VHACQLLTVRESYIAIVWSVCYCVHISDFSTQGASAAFDRAIDDVPLQFQRH